MRQITLSTLEYPTETKARIALQEQMLRINGADSYRAHNEPTLDLVIDRFIAEERLKEILLQPPGEVTIKGGIAYSTASAYMSYLRRHIRPRWGDVALRDIEAVEVKSWLENLPLAPKTLGHLKSLMHMLFERAQLWGLMCVERNLIELVKLRGISKRTKRPLILTPEQYQALVDRLPDPYKMMVTVAMCTGLRVSEVLALRWDAIRFDAGTILVTQGVVNGRIGNVKTEVSGDEVPLDDEFSRWLLAWQAKTLKSSGLVFESPITGGCFHSSTIQQDYLKPAADALGLKGLGWHTLRHTYRSLLDETGAPIGVQQKLMCHANVSTTMNTYGNAALKAKKTANSKVVQMVLSAALSEQLEAV